MARPTKHEYRYKHVGRKTKLTPEVVRKLEEAAAVRATVLESCFYANISDVTYYRWMQKNPELSSRLKELREQPFLKARRSIVNKLDDPAIAFRFLEKEKPEDYGEKIKVEHSGAVATDGREHKEDEELRLEFKQRLLDNIRRRAKEAVKNPE